MIQVKNDIGEFTLVDGEWIDGHPDLKTIFDTVTSYSLYVWEGQTDFAIAERIARIVPGDYEILAEEYPEEYLQDEKGNTYVN